MKTAVQEAPSQAGIELSNWNWKAVRRFVQERFGLALSPSPPMADLNYPVSSTGQALHRLGLVLKRPKKRLLKADPVRREAFVAEYAALTAAAQGNGSKIFFADEAHSQADADPVSRYGAGSAVQVGVGGRASLDGLHQPAP